MKLKQSERTLVTLANGAELVAAVVLKVAGNEVANTIAGSPVSNETIYNLALTQISKAHAKFLPGV